MTPTTPFMTAAQLQTTQQTLLRVALLGTDRAARQLPTQPLPTGNQQGATDAPQWALQWTAQLELISRAAGMQAKRFESVDLKQAPLVQGFDAPRFLPPAAQDALAQCLVLGESAAPLMLDLLERAHAQRCCVPYSLLPETLNYLLRYAPSCLKPLSALNQWQAVLGERGQWLVRSNPAWMPISQNAEDKLITASDWAVSRLAQRLQLLAHLRSSANSQRVAQARDLIESTRASDPPAEVSQHVKACVQGLTMADHDWLEGLLDAKHKPVRGAAIDALSRLPHSALCQRAVAYLTDNSKGAAVLSLSIKRGMFGLLKGSNELVLTLPNTESYDKAVEKTLARDGYDIKARQSTTDQGAAIGAKLALVTQWLSVAPLDVLCERMGVSNADLFAAAAQHESGDDLIEALAQSLLTQARAPAHVLDALMATKKVSHSMQMALIARLSVEQKQAHLMKEGVIPTVSDFCTVFTAAEGISPALSLWILNVLRQYKHDGYNRVWNSSDTVAFALRLDVDKASDFLNEARAEQALNQADTPSNQACYDGYFWKPLFQALDISIQTRRAFAGAASI